MINLDNPIPFLIMTLFSEGTLVAATGLVMINSLLIAIGCPLSRGIQIVH